MSEALLSKDTVKGLLGTIIATCFSQFIASLCSVKSNYSMNYISGGLIVFQWVMFLFSTFGFEAPTEKYYDLSGGVSCVITLVLLYALYSKRTRKDLVLSLMGIVWSARLSYFLFDRIKKTKIDDRFTDIKTNYAMFLMSWTLQGVWVFINITPILMNLLSEGTELSKVNYCGIGLYSLGLLIEIVSDYQKSNFKSIPGNKDRFISTGLWSISRHPNYFGEILLWIGISIASVNSFSIKELAKNAISPLFVAFLLIFVSGIPLLERRYAKKFENDEKYQKYKETTPVLVPFIGRRGGASF